MAAAATNYEIPAIHTSKAGVWTGRVVTTISVLFLFFDGMVGTGFEVRSASACVMVVMASSCGRR